MDSLTQGLLGAVTAQLGFRQKIGRDATWVAGLAAVAPDLDMLIRPILSLSGSEGDAMSPVTYHRGWTHSLVMIPLLAIPIAAGWWYFRRRAAIHQPHEPPPADAATHPEVARKARENPPKPEYPSLWLLYACVFVAMLTHPVLDWLTSYGTQILLPISTARYAADALAIIDVLFTSLLVVTLLACFVVRKLRHGRSPRATLAIGWAGFLLACGYAGAGRAMHDWAVQRALADAPDRRIVRVDAYPSIGSIFLWRTVLETPTRWRVARFHYFAPPDARTKVQVAGKVRNPWIEKARKLKMVRHFDWFAMGRTRATYERVDGRHVVEFHDIRYGVRPEDVESLWSVRVVFGADGELLHAERVQHGRGQDFIETLGDIWSDMWNP